MCPFFYHPERMIRIAHVARVARKAATQELLAGYFWQVGFSGFKVLGLCGYSEFAGSIFEVSCLRGLEVNPEPEALSPKPLNVCLCVCASFRAGFETRPCLGGCAAILVFCSTFLASLSSTLAARFAP